MISHQQDTDLHRNITNLWLGNKDKVRTHTNQSGWQMTRNVVSMATLTASSLNQQKVTIVRKLFSTDQWMCICNISIEIDVTLVTIIYLFNHYGLISTVCVAYFDVLSRVFSYCITIVQSHKISSMFCRPLYWIPVTRVCSFIISTQWAQDRSLFKHLVLSRCPIKTWYQPTFSY